MMDGWDQKRPGTARAACAGKRRWPRMARQGLPVLLASAAFALPQMAAAQIACSAANQLRYDFAAQAAATLNYGTTYNWTATSTGGATQPFSMSFTTNGVINTVVGGVQMPSITNLVNDGAPATANNLVIGMILGGRTTNITGGTNMVRTTISFPTPVRELTVQLNDIDFASNQFRDWIHVRGFNGAASYTGTITTPFGTNNSGGATTNASSTLQLGNSTTPLTVGVNEAIGNASSGNNANNGTLTAVFTEPVTSVVINYGNSNQAPGGTSTGQQAYGIQFIRFCAMPNVTVDKTSAPVPGTLGTFNLPGEFVDYTITVTNSGTSTVDANSAVITDLLPANVTYFHGDIDPAAPGVQTFVFTPGSSGLSLGAGNVSYSNNGGGSYGHTPASGLDPATNGLRFAPTGTMAANSSFSVRFRVAIN